MSALLPGLGQLAQRRWLSAGVQFTTVVAYAIAALGLAGARAAFLAVAWNIYSAGDAYHHDRD